MPACARRTKTHEGRTLNRGNLLDTENRTAGPWERGRAFENVRRADGANRPRRQNLHGIHVYQRKRPFHASSPAERNARVRRMDLATGLARTRVARVAPLHHLVAAGIRLGGFQMRKRRHGGPEGHHNHHQPRTLLAHMHSVNPKPLLPAWAPGPPFAVIEITYRPSRLAQVEGSTVKIAVKPHPTVSS
jgi:hypothetical protein